MHKFDAEDIMVGMHVSSPVLYDNNNAPATRMICPKCHVKCLEDYITSHKESSTPSCVSAWKIGSN